MSTFRMFVNVNDLEDRLKQVVLRAGRVSKRAEAARVPATRAMAVRAQQQMKQNIEEPKSGVFYTSPPLPPWFRRSRRESGVSGGYPASQHGDLVRDILIHQLPDGNAEVRVGENLYRPYAYWLEYGWVVRPVSVSGKPRKVRFPFIRRSVMEISKAEYSEIVANEVRKVIG